MAAEPQSEQDVFDLVAAHVARGVAPFDAARLEGFTLSMLRRADPDRHREILELGRDEQGSFAVTRLRAVAADPEHAGTVRAAELLLRDAGRLQERVTVGVTRILRLS